MRGRQDPLSSAEGSVTSTADRFSNGDVPTAGEALGSQTGVDVPNPTSYLGALIGGGSFGGMVSVGIFLLATYYVYKWNKEAKEAAGDNPDKKPHCGIWSVCCCIFCTPTVCCCP